MIRINGPGRWVTLLLPVLALLVTGCNFAVPDVNGNAPAEAARKTAPTVEAAGPTAAMGLPCFGCHKTERFEDPAVFPHEMHRGMGLHCNQCHEVRAHHKIALNGTTCTGCHNLAQMELATSAMPVTFDHARHMDMFDCRDCHRDTFPMKAGGSRITMARINSGKDCGTCHNGSLASAADNCGNCHKGM